MRWNDQGMARDLLLLGGFALVCFLPSLGMAPLFDWDEINFAESAREMLVTGNYFQVQIDFKPFWEKPPLFIWMQALSMKIFGVTAFAARLPNALVGVCTLMALYIQGSRLRGRNYGKVLTALYLVSLLPFLYFKSGIIDPTFNFFIFMGVMKIVAFERAPQGQKPGTAPLWAGFWIGVATLAKGPVALLVPGLVYVLYKLIWDRRNIPWIALVQFTVVYGLVVLSWFGSIILFTEDGWETVRKFMAYQAELFSQAVAGHEQPFFYHFLVFLLGCFPLSAFAFRGMGLRGLPPSDLVLRNMMLVWFWVVLILFSIVRTKIVHYSSMLYFPGAFLAADSMVRLWQEQRRPGWDVLGMYALGLLVLGGATVGVNAIVTQLPWLQAHATDRFMRSALGAEVAWTGWEFLPGLVFILAGSVGAVCLWKARYRAFFISMLIGMPLFINGLNLLVLPRVADYSQNTAIRFFREKSREDAYLMVQAYKSYAHYFYGEVKPFPHSEIPEDRREAWMANGPIDKPVYMVSRIDRATPEFEGWFVNFHRIGEENGFVFYKRELPETRP
ncbi:MAG: Undecaprenyl phosphate-alpha-4-amino-4-deoxy-L-arabinose arabinosyl transferase [Bacteroidota bacterium]